MADNVAVELCDICGYIKPGEKHSCGCARVDHDKADSLEKKKSAAHARTVFGAKSWKKARGAAAAAADREAVAAADQEAAAAVAREEAAVAARVAAAAAQAEEGGAEVAPQLVPAPAARPPANRRRHGGRR